MKVGSRQTLMGRAEGLSSTVNRVEEEKRGGGLSEEQLL